MALPPSAVGPGLGFEVLVLTCRLLSARTRAWRHANLHRSVRGVLAECFGLATRNTRCLA
jgi:hypothetical protein